MRATEIRFTSTSTGVHIDTLPRLLEKVKEQHTQIGKDRHSDRCYFIKNLGERTVHLKFNLILNENVIAVNKEGLKKQFKAVLIIFGEEEYADEARTIVEFIQKLGIGFTKPDPNNYDELFALVPVVEIENGNSFLQNIKVDHEFKSFRSS